MVMAPLQWTMSEVKWLMSMEEQGADDSDEP